MLEICPSCDSPAGRDSRGRTRKYCSQRCAAIAFGKINIGRIYWNRRIKDVPCEVCKRIFRRHSLSTRFCSSRCFGETLRTLPKQKICRGCGREFEHTGENKNSNKYYCSWKCYMGNRVPWNRGKSFIKDRLCEICSERTGKPWRIETCSPPCASKLRSTISKRLGITPPSQRGKKWGIDYPIEHHPWWRGGVSSLREQIYGSENWKRWRKTIFERDDYSCQICGERGRRLCVDHYPDPFSKILFEEKIKSLKEAEKCERLWDIGNGRVLCIKHHRLTPTYGVNQRFRV